MKKIYIIRKTLFVHNDLENVAVGLGDIVGVFDNQLQAQNAYLACERHQYQRMHISSFEINHAYIKKMASKIQLFFQKNFPQISNFKDITEIPFLPPETTLTQMAEFLQLLDLRHYHLSEHEKMPFYFKINMSESFWGDETEFPFSVFPTEISELYSLQESKEKAIKEALNVSFSYLFHDSLEETNGTAREIYGFEQHT